MSLAGPGSDPIHLAVCCDRDYVMPLGAMLASLVNRADPGRPLTIHALGFDLSPLDWKRLADSVPGSRVEWDPIELDIADLVARGFGTRTFEHISPATYGRLLLPEILPPTVEKVLYLDSDLIVCDDIAPLWDTDIETADLAAAPERNPGARRAGSRRGIRFYRDLGMQPDQILFNVGVLLINLRRWRQTQVACRAFTYTRCLGEQIRWYEQDALNVVANGRYRALDHRWNVPPWGEAPGAGGRTAIVHYLTAHKPWHWDYSWPQRDLFFAALDQTAWTGWRPVRPPLARLRRGLAKLTKAARKRLHALDNARHSLQRTASYRRLSPPSLGDSHAPSRKRGDGGEIRLFLIVAGVDAALRAALEAWGRAGVDRALVLDRSGKGIPRPLRPDYPVPLHLFGSAGAPDEIAFRRLLDQHGEGHWCVLGNVTGILADEAGTPIALRDYCTSLELEGADVAEAVIGPGERMELIARDVRSGRVFRSTAVTVCGPHAYDPPAFGSRAVLLKYGSSMLLDAGAVLVGNARRSVRLLRLSPGGSSLAP